MPIRRKCRVLVQNIVQKVARENKSSIYISNKYDKITTAPSGISSLCYSRNRELFSSHFNNGVLSRNFSTNSSLRMRFVQFSGTNGGPQRLGVQLTQDGDIIDISGVDSSIPNGLVPFLKTGNGILEKAKRVVAEAKSLIPLSEVRLLPPVTSPDKIVCVGLNYRGHCEEQKRPFPEEPVFFSKWSSCIVGPNAEIKHPSVTNMLDWEVELAVVIGKKARNVRPADAMQHVFGFTVAQDITARDWQKNRNGGQWLLGKSMDGSCPLGPSVVVKGVVPDPHSLPIRCSINGVVKQDSNTNELIHKIDYLISYLSHCCTLLPGDVILTGTPAGVGVFRNPQEFLKPGDVIESEIEGIGKLTNTIV
ncbi:oxaloacetate tautomerase fahd2, mitochondrial-like [Periplaneta americana]|uniref:oxaloacetate tautomerase fahd2, mitochondrial-like n=1 Tax=Periplaneta americana TaxID=6978 RepID=UPI0037E963DE